MRTRVASASARSPRGLADSLANEKVRVLYFGTSTGADDARRLDGAVRVGLNEDDMRDETTPSPCPSQCLPGGAERMEGGRQGPVVR